MVPLPVKIEEIEAEDTVGTLPASSGADESLSKAVAVPGRKPNTDPSEEDHNFFHAVGSPTSVVDLFDLCNKSNWHRQQSTVPGASCVEDGSVQAGNSVQSMEISSLSSNFQPFNNGDLMDCLTDDLVLHIMDFLDVKSAVLVFGPSSRRSRIISR
jgi:hypothetical protein